MLRWSLAFILLAAVTMSFAQTPTAHIPQVQSPNDRDYKLTLDVELVQLPVSVLDKDGLPKRGLKPEHFTVYEDKVLQDISLFKEEDVPLSVGIVIDASGSMLEKMQGVHAAAMTFVRESNPDDETFIVSFRDDVILEQDFTSSTRELNRAFAQIRTNGDTALYDAVQLAASHLQQNGSRDKKVLLVVSDGMDNRSRYSLKQVLRTLGESKIMVYTVGLLDSGYPNYPMIGEGKKAMKQLSEVTGGAYFFPKGVNDVEAICSKIANDLRHQYTIGYRPSNPTLDGSWRKVLVRMNPPKNTPALKARTKQGYYAPVSTRLLGQESMK